MISFSKMAFCKLKILYQKVFFLKISIEPFKKTHCHKCSPTSLRSLKFPLKTSTLQDEHHYKFINLIPNYSSFCFHFNIPHFVSILTLHISFPFLITILHNIKIQRIRVQRNTRITSPFLIHFPTTY